MSEKVITFYNNSLKEISVFPPNNTPVNLVPGKTFSTANTGGYSIGSQDIQLAELSGYFVGRQSIHITILAHKDTGARAIFNNSGLNTVMAREENVPRKIMNTGDQFDASNRATFTFETLVESNLIGSAFYTKQCDIKFDIGN